MINLLIIPHEYGLETLRKTSKKYNVGIANKWIELINGFSDDTKEYLFDNGRFPIVDFIKCDKDKLYDEKIDRNIRLYREIGNYKLFKASLFDGNKTRSWDKVFYILNSETGKVYFGGINDKVRFTLGILYGKVENRND
jgi:hypothetical protein